MLRHGRFLILFLFIISFFLATTAVFAAPPKVGDAGATLDQTVGQTGVEKTDVSTMAGTVIRVGLSMVGLIFLILMVYSGFRWMLARGNEEHVTKARNSVIAAAIGFAIVVGAYALSTVAARLITSVSTGDSGSPASTGGALAGDPLGCCLDHFKTPGDEWGAFEQEAWAYRITTQSLCEDMGNNPPDEDRAIGPGTWEFITGMDNAVACGARAERYNARDGFTAL